MADETETNTYSEEEEEDEMSGFRGSNGEEGEEVFYDTVTEQSYAQECVYSDPSSSELETKMRDTQNRDRMDKLIDARSNRDTALYNIQDRLARASPEFYALAQCEMGTRVDLEYMYRVKIVNEELTSLSKDWTNAEDLMYTLVKGYGESQEWKEKSQVILELKEIWRKVQIITYRTIVKNMDEKEKKDRQDEIDENERKDKERKDRQDEMDEKERKDKERKDRQDEIDEQERKDKQDVKDKEGKDRQDKVRKVKVSFSVNGRISSAIRHVVDLFRLGLKESVPASMLSPPRTH